MSDNPQNNRLPQQPPAEDPQEALRKARQQRNRQRSVVFYIFILFSAAFILLGMSLMMEQRQNAEEMNDLTQSITGLKDSVSAMQSVQALYEENAQLLEEINRLEQILAQQTADKADMSRDISDLNREITALNHKIDQLNLQSQSMDWFWQIDEAYVLGRYSKARELIAQMEQAALKDCLPEESITDNGRFSPKDRLEEICQALY